MASARRRSGYVVENSIGIAAPAEAVFDYVTDVRREPEWNPQLREAEKLTPGPVGAGTRHPVPGPVRPRRRHGHYREYCV